MSEMKKNTGNESPEPMDMEGMDEPGADGSSSGPGRMQKLLKWVVILAVPLGGWLGYKAWADTRAGYEATITQQRKKIEQLRKELSTARSEVAKLRKENAACRVKAQLVVKRTMLRERIRRVLVQLKTALSGEKSPEKLKDAMYGVKEGLFAIDSFLEWERDHSEGGLDGYVYGVMRRRLKLEIDGLGATTEATDLADRLTHTRETLEVFSDALPIVTGE